jgi:hypothetical protein
MNPNRPTIQFKGKSKGAPMMGVVAGVCTQTPAIADLSRVRRGRCTDPGHDLRQ